MAVCGERQFSEDKASFLQAIVEEFDLKQWGNNSLSCSEISYPGILSIFPFFLYFGFLNPSLKIIGLP